MLAYLPLNGDARILTDNPTNDFTVASGGSFVAGKLGGGLSTTNGGIRLSSSSNSLGSSRTLCAWIRPDTRSGAGAPVFVAGTSGAADFLAVTASSSRSGACSAAPNALYLDHSGRPCVTSGEVVAQAATWTFACWAYESVGRVTLYASGESDQLSAQLYSWSLRSTSPLLVGQNPFGGTTTASAFRGVIDEISIWPRALARSEMDALYGSGRGCILEPSGS